MGECLRVASSFQAPLESPPKQSEDGGYGDVLILGSPIFWSGLWLRRREWVSHHREWGPLPLGRGVRGQPVPLTVQVVLAGSLDTEPKGRACINGEIKHDWALPRELM